MKVLVCLVALLVHFDFNHSITTIESLKEIQCSLTKNYSTEGAAAWGSHSDGSYSYSLLKNRF